MHWMSCFAFLNLILQLFFSLIYLPLLILILWSIIHPPIIILIPNKAEIN